MITVSVLSLSMTTGSAYVNTAGNLTDQGGLVMLITWAFPFALLWRDRAPYAVTAITLIPAFAAPADTVASLIALSVLFSRRREKSTWLMAALVAAVTWFSIWKSGQRPWYQSLLAQLFTPLDDSAQTRTDPAHFELVAITIGAVVLTGVAVGIGLIRRARFDLSESQRREVATAISQAQIQHQQRFQEELTRAARDVHDTAAYHLSRVSLQANALVSKVDPTDEDTLNSLTQIQQGASKSITEIQRIITTMRDPASALNSGLPADHETFMRIRDLIEERQSEGMAIVASVFADESSTLGDEISATAYRIVQESLANATRHAAGLPVTLAIIARPADGITITVSNPVPGDRPAEAPETGFGITGMTERVSRVGGLATIGVNDGSTFSVEVWLPWHQEERS